MLRLKALGDLLSASPSFCLPGCPLAGGSITPVSCLHLPLAGFSLRLSVFACHPHLSRFSSRKDSRHLGLEACLILTNYVCCDLISK